MKKDMKWSIDPSHSEITFKVKHLMIANVRGEFKKFEADIHTTGLDFTTAAVDMTIDPSSITTGDVKRDEHLKGPDFFDVLNHKEITFSANTISKPDASGKQEMWGELTIKGITKNVKLDVAFGGVIHDPWGNERAGFSITGKINRTDWKLTWNTALVTGGVMVSE
jgi:polyisoprenoid-binding protein YceI